MNQQSYTDLSGKVVTVQSLDWLEDGTYWLEDENGSVYLDAEYGFESGDNYPCSRYSIGVDESGDGISVWLNCDMEEVDA